MTTEIKEQKEFVIYQANDGSPKIEVRLENETIWLTNLQLTELFQTTKSNVSEHIKHIFEEGELNYDSTVRKFRTVATNGKTYEMEHYNLDMIISLGYRINSRVATNFRIWATQRLKEYIVKGFTMDDERLKGNGGGRIDYNPKAAESIRFFKIVQNKLHYAAHGHTAAEVIAERADAGKPFMGLTVFSGSQPTIKDISIAKNYLNEEELKILNNLVSGYFDFAEIQAMKRRPMYMEDYMRQLDNILSSTGEQVLQNSGKISHEQAMEKAKAEYRKYQQKTLSDVEMAYLETIKTIEKSVKGKYQN
ncbi:toxin Fic [Bacteroidia bacterium]|nr:toxin Fic [Bacteroidia bacterium]GHT26695.1 toxin Fic [Bacteroidia bacterium]